MAGPMQMYLYSHDAILREVAALEDAAREINRDDATEISQFADRIQWFRPATKAHESSEETIMFPALDARYKHVAAAYFFDHDHFEPNFFGEMNKALETISRSSGDERKKGAQRLHRQSIAFNENMRLHIAKENELLIPIISSEFEIDEQIKIAGAMAASIEPKLMGEMTGFMYLGQNETDREGMIRFLMRALPPEAFGNVKNMLSNLGSADDWLTMEKRIPELTD